MSTQLHPANRNRPLELEHLPIGDLKPDPRAPRRHKPSQIKALAKSIVAFGFNVPVLIDADGMIIAGHARVAAAGEVGLGTVPAIRLAHLDDAAVRAFMIADNRLSELSEWDDQLLGTILRELSLIDLSFDIEATGFAVAEIDLRIEGLGEDDDDGADALPPGGPSVASIGDLWKLGEHRLFCGDALQASSWEVLMGDERATLVVTDAPYNVKIDGHVSGLGRHRHREFAMAAGEMTQDQFTTFLTTAARHAAAWSTPGSVHYWAMDWRHLLELTLAGQAAYDRQLNLCAWIKGNAGMGSFYRSQHELFMVFAKGGAPHRNNVQLGRFGRSRSNVWSYPGASNFGRGERGSGEGNPLALHPTVKPTALIADILLDASARGDIVADPFMGSGTTIIAAEKLGRKARGIELDPLYCDTIIRRWQAWSGQQAVRAGDGVLFDAVQSEADGIAAAPDRGDA